jgi:hypothetical protein
MKEVRAPRNRLELQGNPRQATIFDSNSGLWSTILEPRIQNCGN